MPPQLRNPRWNGEAWEDDITEEVFEQIRSGLYASLQRVFSESEWKVKKLAIGKPWMTDPQAVNALYETYESLYSSALKGLFDEATNAAIIAAHEAAETAVAPVVLLMNDVRRAIEARIEAATPDDYEEVQGLIAAAEAVTIPPEGVTDEWIASVREQFGIEEGV